MQRKGANHCPKEQTGGEYLGVFPKCANGTHLPLTEEKGSARMDFLPREKIYHTSEAPTDKMGSTITNPGGRQAESGPQVTYEHLRALLDAVEKPVVVANRDGIVLLTNALAQKYLKTAGKDPKASLNIFQDVLNLDPKGISKRLESGENDIELKSATADKAVSARVRWIPESNWIMVQLTHEKVSSGFADGSTQLTVQE